MTQKTLYDVAGVGNAIVDVLSFTDEAFLAEQALVKGSMTLVDEARSHELYSRMGQTTGCSGGSVANTLAGIASLGAKTAFIGKVRDDQLGRIFTHDMHGVGVHFQTPPIIEGPTTANCLVYVTPDAHRTMATYIGACSLVSETDIDEDIIRQSGITYIEGYLWDTENAKAAIRKAIAVARKAQRKTAFTLSDVFCVDRHRADFFDMIKRDFNILFANESEIKSLYQTDDIAVALKKVQGVCEIVVVTRGEKGSVVITADEKQIADAYPISRVVDTTGAGDLYASGFLYGLSRGWDMMSCADLGNRCAGEIITQLGARSMRPLHELVA